MWTTEESNNYNILYFISGVMSLYNMPFETNCASGFLHKGWNIPATHPLIKVLTNAKTHAKQPL